MQRDSLIFYRSFVEAIQDLPDESHGRIYNAIFNYALDGIIPDLQGAESTIFKLMKPQLDANARRYENGKKGGRRANEQTSVPETVTKPEPNRNQSGTETKPNTNQNQTKAEPNHNQNETEQKAKPKQTESKPEANVNGNVNGNGNGNENANENESGASAPTRPKKLSLDERKKAFYVEVAQFKESYPKEMLRAFFEYWTEPNQSATKFRKEMEKTWDTSRRLGTWASRDKTVSASQKEPETIKITTAEELRAKYS